MIHSGSLTIARRGDKRVGNSRRTTGNEHPYRMTHCYRPKIAQVFATVEPSKVH